MASAVCDVTCPHSIGNESNVVITIETQQKPPGTPLAKAIETKTHQVT